MLADGSQIISTKEVELPLLGIYGTLGVEMLQFNYGLTHFNYLNETRQKTLQLIKLSFELIKG